MTNHRTETKHRFSLIHGALALLIVVVVVAGTTGVLVSWRSTLHAESEAFVDRAVPVIAANWNKKALLDLATPKVRADVKPEDLQALANLDQLGAFADYMGAAGEVNWLSLTPFAGPVSASYVARARFKNGIATFQFTLVRLGGHWRISEYHIDGQLLGPPRPNLLLVGPPTISQ